MADMYSKRFLGRRGFGADWWIYDSRSSQLFSGGEAYGTLFSSYS